MGMQRPQNLSSDSKEGCSFFSAADFGFLSKSTVDFC